MSRPHRLALLKVGISGENDVDGRARPLQKGTLYLGQCDTEAFRHLHAPQTEIGRHLVVARPARMELSGDLTDLFVKQTLHQGMDVLIRLNRR